MKKRLEYTLVAEGFAEYAFIPIYLKRVAELFNIQVVRSNLDLQKGQPSKSNVLKKAEDLCLRALRDKGQAFCIVGIDLDEPDHTDDQELHLKECNILIKALGSAHKKYNEQIVIYVPIQAIEHWLAYQLYHLKHFQKPHKGSVEKQHQKELKRQLYGDREDRQHMQTVAQTVAEKADFDELAKQSRSFDHFHQQIVTFLASYNNTTKP